MTDWRTQGACWDSGIDFYPETGGNTHAKQLKAICAGCQVRTECLDEAMARRPTNDEHGVWGGLTARERRNLRRQRWRAARRTA